jgi:hypothetical protein
MEPRILILALPSLAVIALLVWHSWRSLPRRRMVVFWISVTVYGVLRGVALAWVNREDLGKAVQQAAGWAIVAYLAWWLGERFARQEKQGPRLFLQVAWGCLFLGAIGWAVEALSAAAGWRHWTGPTGSEVLLRVPLTGLVDWFFVGTDFLLPFLVLTAPALAGRPVRFLAILLFPLHMVSHLWVANLLVHWLLLGLVLWLALRVPTEDAAFSDSGRIPAAALGIMLLDIALVELFLVDQPMLLVSTVPAAAVALQALRPGIGFGVAAGAVAGSLALPPLILSALPGFSVLVLRFGRRNRWAAPALMAALASLALVMHGRVGKAEEDLKRRLDEALRRGEIQYRAGRLDEARASYEEAVEIKQDFVEGYRYLTAIHLRRGRRDAAAESAARGLAVAPGDLELRYLQGREIGEIWPEIEAEGPVAAKALAGLASEVGDVSGAVEVLDRGIARWPEDRELRDLRGRLTAP